MNEPAPQDWDLSEKGHGLVAAHGQQGRRRQRVSKAMQRELEGSTHL